MVLRISIYSNTKKFFQKTIDNVKCFLSGGAGSYQKLPKSSPLCNPLSCGRGGDQIKIELEAKKEEPKNLYRKGSEKGMIKSSTMERHEEKTIGNAMKHIEEKTFPNDQLQKNKNGNAEQQIFEWKMAQNHQVCDHRSYLVAEKLKQLAMIDKSNEEHALDIQEVLHYYSRLTCPAYRDIVDNFFVDMYSEFFRSSIKKSST
ncbi:hypothetical protein LIER_21263 [Lithospermum erythrorhizon]|uniref:OVATE domain-containing protein n=1 Tax=Lithospermum erythrorhizon TaxID=34254 RepID=A0AAV3QPP7_LITER